MRKNNLILVAILAIFSITVLLLFYKNDNTINVYCCPEEDELKVCIPSEVPDYENLVSAVLYYKIDDNCSFQTLRYQYCGDSIFYSVIGRFNSVKLSNGKYQLNKLETKFVSGLDKSPKIVGVKIDESSTEDNLILIFEVDFKDNSSTIDYTYGLSENEEPIIINKNAQISFGVLDRTSLLKNCDDVRSDNEEPRNFTSGGYECDGEATTEGGG